MVKQRRNYAVANSNNDSNDRPNLCTTRRSLRHLPVLEFTECRHRWFPREREQSLVVIWVALIVLKWLRLKDCNLTAVQGSKVVSYDCASLVTSASCLTSSVCCVLLLDSGDSYALAFTIDTEVCFAGHMSL